MRLHHLAALTALLTFALMVLGSVVHGTGSSLACPDWPLCHGTALPPMTGGIAFEHSHRLVALAVVALVAVVALRARRLANARARRLAFGAAGLVLLQSALGAATVLLRLPPAVSIAHLATSMGVLSALVGFTVDVMPTRARPVPDARAARAWVSVAAGAALLQAISGALVRHTGAALACATFPDCNGVAWPDATLARVQTVHRAGAVAVALLVLAAMREVLARAPRGSALRRIAVVPMLIVVAQIALGATVVLTGAPLRLVTVHHATGAALLAALVTVWGALAISGTRSAGVGIHPHSLRPSCPFPSSLDAAPLHTEKSRPPGLHARAMCDPPSSESDM